MNDQYTTDGAYIGDEDKSLEDKHDKSSDVLLHIEQAMEKDRTAFTELFGDKEKNEAIEKQIKEEVAALFSVLAPIGADKIEVITASVVAEKPPVPEKTAELIAQKPREPEIAAEAGGRAEKIAAYHDEAIAYSDRLYTIIQARLQYKTALRMYAYETAADNSMPNMRFTPIVEAMIAQMNKVDDPLMSDYTTYQALRFAYKEKPAVIQEGSFAQKNPMKAVEEQLKDNEKNTKNNMLFKEFIQDLSREDCVLTKRLFWDKRDYAKQILTEMIDNQGKDNHEEKKLTLWQRFLDLLFPTGKEMREKYQKLTLDVDKYREILTALGPTQTKSLSGEDDYDMVRNWRMGQ